MLEHEDAVGLIDGAVMGGRDVVVPERCDVVGRAAVDQRLVGRGGARECGKPLADDGITGRATRRLTLVEDVGLACPSSRFAARSILIMSITSTTAAGSTAPAAVSSWHAWGRGIE